MLKTVFALCFLSAALGAAPVPNAVVEKAGAERISVTLDLPAGAYAKTLARNLSISGWFTVAPEGAIRVTGTPGVSVAATGRGKTVTATTAFTDEAGARMAARRFADAMVKAFTDGGHGFAATRLAFIDRKGTDNAELYTCYPDGWDIRQLTADKCAAVGPRWAPDGENINKAVGSTHLENLEKAAVEGGFDCGIAFDGDAARCLGCDEKGQERDGDKIIALLAMTMQETGLPAISLTGWQAGIHTDGNHAAAEITAIHRRRILRELAQAR